MTSESNAYPGERLGLPVAGSRSIARFGRRILALIVDLAAANLIGFALFDNNPWANNIIFALLHVLFIPTLGGSPGHLLLGMRVVRMAGGWVGLWRPLVRTALLFLIIPAVVFDADQRGIHDKAAGTVLLRA